MQGNVTNQEARQPLASATRPDVPLRRPDGRWQLGVGPGALVIEDAGCSDPDIERLAKALAKVPTPVLPHSGRSVFRVEGTGPLAARLAAGLAELAAPAQPSSSYPDNRGADPTNPEPTNPGSGAGFTYPTAQPANPGAGLNDSGQRRPAQPPRVLVQQQVIPPEQALALAQHQRTVLPVVLQGRRVVIGPCCDARSGPCLHCLDLTRRDRDPSWPAVATQLGHPTAQLAPIAIPHLLQQASESLVLMLCQAWVPPPAQLPWPPGLSYELAAGRHPLVTLRQWQRHPECPWH